MAGSGDIGEKEIENYENGPRGKKCAEKYADI